MDQLSESDFDSKKGGKKNPTGRELQSYDQQLDD